MLASVSRRMVDPTDPAIEYEILGAEDIANAVISCLATPPNVLVSDLIILIKQTFISLIL